MSCRRRSSLLSETESVAFLPSLERLSVTDKHDSLFCDIAAPSTKRAHVELGVDTVRGLILEDRVRLSFNGQLYILVDMNHKRTTEKDPEKRQAWKQMGFLFDHAQQRWILRRFDEEMRLSLDELVGLSKSRTELAQRDAATSVVTVLDENASSLFKEGRSLFEMTRHDSGKTVVREINGGSTKSTTHVWKKVGCEWNGVVWSGPLSLYKMYTDWSSAKLASYSDILQKVNSNTELTQSEGAVLKTMLQRDIEEAIKYAQEVIIPRELNVNLSRSVAPSEAKPKRVTDSAANIVLNAIMSFQEIGVRAVLDTFEREELDMSQYQVRWRTELSTPLGTFDIFVRNHSSGSVVWSLIALDKNNRKVGNEALLRCSYMARAVREDDPKQVVQINSRNTLSVALEAIVANMKSKHPEVDIDREVRDWAQKKYVYTTKQETGKVSVDKGEDVEDSDEYASDSSESECSGEEEEYVSEGSDCGSSESEFSIDEEGEEDEPETSEESDSESF